MTKAELLHVADETKLRREALYEEGECGSILDYLRIKERHLRDLALRASEENPEDN